LRVERGGGRTPPHAFFSRDPKKSWAVPHDRKKEEEEALRRRGVCLRSLFRQASVRFHTDSGFEDRLRR